MKNQSEQKVCCITGAALRIGASIARKFHQQGFNVVIHCNRSVEAAELLTQELNQLRPNSATFLQADFGNKEQMEIFADKVLQQYERLDVLVNNASSFYPTLFGEAKQFQWDDLIDSNLRAAFFLSQRLSHELGKRKGSIVNIADTHADKPLLNHSIYCIAKAGVKAMTKSLALELSPEVRVNAVSPGAILWPASLQETEDSPLPDDKANELAVARAKILKQIPLGKLGEPEFIADAVYFLASEASYMTGQVIKVDGGRALF